MMNVKDKYQVMDENTNDKKPSGLASAQASGSVSEELIMINGVRCKFVQSKEKPIVGGNVHGFYIGKLDPDATIEVPVEE